MGGAQRRVKSFPTAGVVVVDEFDAKAPNGGILKVARGLRVEGGGTFYRCVRPECSGLMYETPQAVMAHSGIDHPSEITLRRRELRDKLAEIDKAKGIEPAPAPRLGRPPKAKPEPAEKPGAQMELMAIQAEPVSAGRMLPALNRKRGRNSRQPMGVEDTLDFMGAEIVEQTKGTIDLLLQSREENRKLHLAALEELERTKRQLAHALKVIAKINGMTLGVISSMGNGEEESNG